MNEYDGVNATFATFIVCIIDQRTNHAIKLYGSLPFSFGDAIAGRTAIPPFDRDDTLDILTRKIAN